MKQAMHIWDPSSPGMRVWVYRGWLARLLLSPDFATLTESIRCYEGKVLRRVRSW